ncbi:hypothetical protein ACFWPQ_00805 [Streptomyces sp. NPDC058464]
MALAVRNSGTAIGFAPMTAGLALWAVAALTAGGRLLRSRDA